MRSEWHDPRWLQALPPPVRSCRHWSPTGPAGLAGVRREFRDEISTSAVDGRAVVADQVVDALTALEELVSNALRHGRAPVEVELCVHDAGYVVLVTDHSPAEPPRPTSTRDPADGGMGLGMIAATALTCGWFSDRTVKTVWALMPVAAAPRRT